MTESEINNLANKHMRQWMEQTCKSSHCLKNHLVAAITEAQQKDDSAEERGKGYAMGILTGMCFLYILETLYNLL